jgi:Dyp-type peroxidase family
VVGKLQEGIYYAPGTRPGKFFGLLLLRAARGLEARQVGESFGILWDVYQDLKRGKVRDLPGHDVPSGDLTVLVGYGANVFNVPKASRSLPSDLGRFGVFRSPLPTGGGPLLKGSGLWYANDVRANPATEDVAVQFIAETQLAVDRAIVETWKMLQDITDPATGAAPLLITSFYTGFQRDDGRSWLGFHDGVSNLKSKDRLGVISIEPSAAQEEQWTEGGTYLAFLRLGIDLTSWRKLDRRQQELMVGRDKLTGCSLVGLDGSGNPVAEKGCPVSGTREIDVSGDPNQPFLEPPNTAVATLRQSHVQRANRHVADPDRRNSLRVFRQGYEFLEPSDAAPGFRAGLNFVSFQDTPERLFRMLTQPGWLGGTNFGGDPEHQLPGMTRLLTVRAAGVFLVPPISEEEPFVGSSIF